MVRLLEGQENIAAVELGFAPLLADDILLLTIEMCLGELPLIVCLPVEQVLSLGPRAVQEGATAISLAAPRGMLPIANDSPLHLGEGPGVRVHVTGRLQGPALFPQALLAVRDAAQANLPVIAAGGVVSKENADAMLSAGALAVQMDASLWKGDLS